ncbi:MAG: sugar nucleotide-binding protein [bacterium]
MILIVGGTSTIGQAIIHQAERMALTCAFTCRKPGASHFLDLKFPSHSWEFPEKVETAILCAAVNGLGACETNPLETRAVNVTAMMSLANRLAAQGAKITFLSSNQVFGPNASVPAEDSEPSPATEYGRQKLAVERHLLAKIPGAQIIRLTKVISPALQLFAKWAASLAAGQTISAYSDLFFSPIALDSTVAMILKIASSPHSGIFHLSSADAISYLDAARWLAVRVGTEPSLVQSVPAPSPNTPDSCRLNCKRTVELVGYCISSPMDHLPALF